MNMRKLVIKHRKLNPIFLFLSLFLFLTFYLTYVRHLDPKSYFIFTFLCIVFSLYFFIFSLWTDTAIFDKTTGEVISERGVWPFRKVTKDYVTFFSYVSIVAFAGGGGTGRRYLIRL